MNDEYVTVRSRPWSRNVAYWTIASLLFLVGFIGSVEALVTLVSGHSIREDHRPPTIDSMFTSSPGCLSTLIVPDALVKEPGRWWEHKSGIKTVKLYVGGDKVGEWPIIEANAEKVKFRGERFSRRTMSEGGDIVVVAEDHKGNVSSKRLRGTYSAPYCYSSASAAAKRCVCDAAPYTSDVLHSEEAKTTMPPNEEKTCGES